MDAIKCPNCSTPMHESDDPDVALDICPGCDGRFFDKGELNDLATSLPGDIEGRSLAWTDVVHSVEQFAPADTRLSLGCPRCDDQPMKKVGLVTFADIVFDFCPKCEGFFLNAGEVESMNQKLKEQSAEGRSDEYRGRHQGHLVRGNMVIGGAIVGIPPLEGGIATTAIQVVVYFDPPRDLGLHLYPERWPAKLAKAFGLFGDQDIATGDAKFDAAFVIRGNDEAGIRDLFSPDVRKATMEFASAKPQLISHDGTLEMFDHCLCYTEGPCRGKANVDWQSPPATEIIDGLVRIATAMA